MLANVSPTLDYVTREYEIEDGRGVYGNNHIRQYSKNHNRVNYKHSLFLMFSSDFPSLQPEQDSKKKKSPTKLWC